MIFFEIIKGPASICGKYLFHLNEITLSSEWENKKRQGYLILPFPTKNYLSIKVTEGGHLIASSQLFLSVNRKNHKYKALVNKEDTLGLDGISLKVLDFSYEKNNLFKDVVNESLEKIIQDKEPVLELLRKIKP